MLIDVAIPGDRNVINGEAAMIVEYKARVEYKNKCGISNIRGDWNRFKITWRVPEQRTGKARNLQTTKKKKTAILETTNKQQKKLT